MTMMSSINSVMILKHKSSIAIFIRILKSLINATRYIVVADRAKNCDYLQYRQPELQTLYVTSSFVGSYSMTDMKLSEK